MKNRPLQLEDGCPGDSEGKLLPAGLLQETPADGVVSVAAGCPGGLCREGLGSSE